MTEGEADVNDGVNGRKMEPSSNTPYLENTTSCGRKTK